MRLTCRNRILACMALVGTLSGCAKYDAEIGYFDGAEKRFDYWGDFSSLDECRNAAIGRFNAMNADKSGRAFSWACMEKNADGGYASRHR